MALYAEILKLTAVEWRMVDDPRMIDRLFKNCVLQLLSENLARKKVPSVPVSFYRFGDLPVRVSDIATASESHSVHFGETHGEDRPNRIRHLLLAFLQACPTEKASRALRKAHVRIASPFASLDLSVSSNSHTARQRKFLSFTFFVCFVSQTFRFFL